VCVFVGHRTVTFMFLSPAGTQLLSTTMGVKDYVQGEFDSVQAEIINANKDLFPESVTCDDFLWAFGVLRSRVFPELRGEKLALIPFADLVSSECKICPSIVTM
jgi:[ribulose-bisphosphate carboxylase]/[fructose-bisphosphate aldolase]-lysine N-methyltransferase